MDSLRGVLGVGILCTSEQLAPPGFVALSARRALIWGSQAFHYDSIIAGLICHDRRRFKKGRSKGGIERESRALTIGCIILFTSISRLQVAVYDVIIYSRSTHGAPKKLLKMSLRRGRPCTTAMKCSHSCR